MSKQDSLVSVIGLYLGMIGALTYLCWDCQPMSFFVTSRFFASIFLVCFAPFVCLHRMGALADRQPCYVLVLMVRMSVAATAWITISQSAWLRPWWWVAPAMITFVNIVVCVRVYFFEASARHDLFP